MSKSVITLTSSPSPAAASTLGHDSNESHSLTVAPGNLSDAQLAGILISQYRKAVGAIHDIAIMGAIMLQAEKVVLTRENKTRGPGTKGQGLKGWLAEHAPEINYNNAYRFMRLAEGLRDEFQLGVKCDMVHLLSAPIEELKKGEIKTREKINAFLEGKSQRQLLFEFGYGEGKKKGGKQTKSETSESTKVTPEQEAEEHCTHLLSSLDLLITENWHTLLPKDLRTQLCSALAETKRKVEGVK